MTDAIMKLLINERVIGEQLMSSLRFIFICSIRIVSQLLPFIPQMNDQRFLPRCHDAVETDYYLMDECRMIVS